MMVTLFTASCFSFRPREPVTALNDFVSASALATLAGSTEPARLIASAKSLMPLAEYCRSVGLLVVFFLKFGYLYFNT